MVAQGPNVTPTEAQDAARVNEAFAMIQRGQTVVPEGILQAVIANAPGHYVYKFWDGPSQIVKFWDAHEFFHYVAWQKEHGSDQTTVWLPSAYPRAFFYLAFLKVARGEYAAALPFLDQGQALEPTNPNFYFERGQALARSHRLTEALAEYKKVDVLGPHTSSSQLATALRGQGFVLIELAQLDEAEALFQQSLALDPNSQVAQNEIKYIRELRTGGPALQPVITRTAPQAVNTCERCSKAFNAGQLVAVDKRSVFLCKSCVGKFTKRWWEFWK